MWVSGSPSHGRMSSTFSSDGKQDFERGDWKSKTWKGVSSVGAWMKKVLQRGVSYSLVDVAEGCPGVGSRPEVMYRECYVEAAMLIV